jgi:hypothetical protein
MCAAPCVAWRTTTYTETHTTAEVGRQGSRVHSARASCRGVRRLRDAKRRSAFATAQPYTCPARTNAPPGTGRRRGV